VKPAEAAVDREKRRQLLAVAREYLRHLPPSCPWRLDVLSVTTSSTRTSRRSNCSGTFLPRYSVVEVDCQSKCFDDPLGPRARALEQFVPGDPLFCWEAPRWTNGEHVRRGGPQPLPQRWLPCESGPASPRTASRPLLRTQYR
jgi:hypothetical protein